MKRTYLSSRECCDTARDRVVRLEDHTNAKSGGCRTGHRKWEPEVEIAPASALEVAHYEVHECVAVNRMQNRG